MHYLQDLANKLVATYRDASAAGHSEEERRKLVAAIRCALELETGRRQREEAALNPLPEYEPSEAFSPPSPVAAEKE